MNNNNFMNNMNSMNQMSFNSMNNNNFPNQNSFNIGMFNYKSLNNNFNNNSKMMNNKNNQNMNNQSLQHNNINNINNMNNMFNSKSLNYNNIRNNNNQHNFQRNYNNNNNNNLNTIIEEENPEEKICQKHKNRIGHYCIQCDKYYCSECLIMRGEEEGKHNGHSFLQLSKLENNPDLQNALKEYKKIPQSKKDLENYIGLCNLKLRENEIKKREIVNFINAIKESYIKKLDETTNELKNISNSLIPKKEEIEYRIASIPNGFNNIINSNDYAQGTVIKNELKKLNTFDPNIENSI